MAMIASGTMLVLSAGSPKPMVRVTTPSVSLLMEALNAGRGSMNFYHGSSERYW